MNDQHPIPHATHTPHELGYHVDFEDAVMRVVLDANTKQDGIQLVMDDELEQIPAHATRASDVNQSTLPLVHDGEVPLSLSDPRRIYASAVPEIKLSHPGGFLEGGPGMDPSEEDSFTRDFLSRNDHIVMPEDLHTSIQAETDDNLVLLHERMHARQQAIHANEQIEKEIQNMVDTHNMEAKVRQRLMDEVKAKKEARERKRREREGG